MPLQTDELAPDVVVWGTSRYLSIEARTSAGSKFLRQEWHLVHRGCLIDRGLMNTLERKAQEKGLTVTELSQAPEGLK